MPKLIIDNQEIEVAPGTKVIEAAAQLDIMIPRFCYHPALGSVGACRVCAVKFEQGPFKGVQMSCMIDAQDGMVVSTTDPEAVAFRMRVIEWLMLHHPHDCPVCDEGGHCLLQDMTVSGGHGIRRYAGNKRTYRDQYLGPLLQHEMNRCIHCYRCSRFYQDFCGYRDLGALKSANQTYFGRYEDGVLESPFCGNLSDICPTGVYTDKPSRFFGRRWDYVRSPSLCINCSLGCHTIASSRYREVKRQEARYSESVNGHFICDRGRYGFFYSNLPGRPRTAKIGENHYNFTHTQSVLGEKLKEIGNNAGPSAIAAACSMRSSLETRTALSHLCRINNWQRPAFFSDPATARKAKTVAARLEPQLKVSLREMEKADFVFVVGADPLNEAPMLALALRQAQRNGAAVFVLDPRPISLPFAFRHLPVRPGALNHRVGQLMQRAVDQGAAAGLGDKVAAYLEGLPGAGSLSDSELQFSDDALQHLQRSKRPVFVCGTQIVAEATIGVMADFALLLQASDKQAAVFPVLPGANASAGDTYDAEDVSLLQIIEEIEKGFIKALILVETNPYWCFPDRQRLDNALDNLDLLVVLDYLHSRAVRKAHIFLPTQTIYESGGLYANQEGRVQYAPAVFSGGKPVSQIDGGDHPPRVYDAGIPESDLQPAWLTLAQLADENLAADTPEARETIRELLAGSFPEIRKYESFNQIPEDGFHLSGAVKPELRFSLDWIRDVKENQDPDDDFELLLTEWTFGTEELSSLSPCLAELEPEPCLVMHLRDAQELGCTSGDFVEISTGLGSLQVMVAVNQNMAPGVICLPRHPRLPWQIFKDMKINIKKEQIRKRT